MTITQLTSAAVLVVNPRIQGAADENPGTAERPMKTIGAAAKIVKPGDTVRIHDGVYRESVVVEASGTPEQPITFEAAPGSRVLLTGADALTSWTKLPGSENIYSTVWPHRFISWNRQFTHPDDDFHRVIGRAEQCFILGYPLRQVLAREQLGRGAFFVDLDARRIFICPADGRDLARTPVEAATRPQIWESKGACIQVRGLHFRYAANSAQKGGAAFSGDSGLVEDCVFERMNGGGAHFGGKGITVRRCVFQDNGQIGFGASHAHKLTLQDCVIRNNNIKGFNRDWEAGGAKICLSRGVLVERCRFIENRGNGLWFDIGNESPEVRASLFADNEGSGIFYEISYGLHAHDNVMTGNGLADYPGAWGASAGIAISSSPGCVIERNLLVGNKEGLAFREQNRQTARIDGSGEEWVWNHDEAVRNNVMAFNRDAQTWGWFTTEDGRHWPAAMQEAMRERRRAKPGEDVAAKYLAAKPSGAPAGLTLEKLKLTFADNLYLAAPGQGLFHWGPQWQKHKEYASLEEVRRELALEQGSRVADPGFAGLAARDLSVKAASPAVQMGCYPKEEVPDVRLGRME